ncbi:hypothetical protein [Variovorax paradoxus]|uniref:hypothetical protein n=1 Tax=Variovorax paradoxus TaxID=34073 RepID=UPI001ABCAB64
MSEAIEDVALAGLGHVLDIDPSIVELADLEPGFQATRERLGANWVIEKTPLDEG